MFLNEVYKVDREDYKRFVYRLTGGHGYLETEENDEYIITAMISKRTDKIWCARKTWKNGNPEEYYIVDYPDKDEWDAPVEIRNIVLEDKEQVQTLLNALTKKR